MSTKEQIERYIAAQPEPKRVDMRALHARILAAMPGCRLWFLDGAMDILSPYSAEQNKNKVAASQAVCCTAKEGEARACRKGYRCRCI